MIKKLLIFGSEGMLGHYIFTYFSRNSSYQVVGLTRKDFDAFTGNLKEIQNIFEKYQVNQEWLVFNALGLIKHAEQQYGTFSLRNYLKVNAIFPHLLAQVSTQYGAKMIHPSTDCIFSGKTGKYTEDQDPDEENEYGLSKLLGEPSQITVIRTSIIGEEVKNKRSLLEWVRKNKGNTIKGFTNHYWNGITCLQYAKVVEKIIEHDCFWQGVRHILSPNTVSKEQLVSWINEIYKLNITVESHTCPVAVDRSLDSIYQLPFNLPDLYTQIAELKKFQI